MNLFALDRIQGDYSILYNSIQYYSQDIHLFLFGYLCQIHSGIEIFLNHF